MRSFIWLALAVLLVFAWIGRLCDVPCRRFPDSFAFDLCGHIAGNSSLHRKTFHVRQINPSGRGLNGLAAGVTSANRQFALAISGGSFISASIFSTPPAR